MKGSATEAELVLVVLRMLNSGSFIKADGLNVGWLASVEEFEHSLELPHFRSIEFLLNELAQLSLVSRKV